MVACQNGHSDVLELHSDVVELRLTLMIVTTTKQQLFI